MYVKIVSQLYTCITIYSLRKQKAATPVDSLFIQTRKKKVELVKKRVEIVVDPWEDSGDCSHVPPPAFIEI
jgi:hypothetical protein